MKNNGGAGGHITEWRATDSRHQVYKQTDPSFETKNEVIGLERPPSPE